MLRINIQKKERNKRMWWKWRHLEDAMIFLKIISTLKMQSELGGTCDGMQILFYIVQLYCFFYSLCNVCKCFERKYNSCLFQPLNSFMVFTIHTYCMYSNLYNLYRSEVQAVVWRSFHCIQEPCGEEANGGAGRIGAGGRTAMGPKAHRLPGGHVSGG